MALSASAVVDDGALLIDGDDGDNSINVSILGDAVTVSLDGAAPQTFTGLGSAFHAVKIDAQGGDDSVTVDASGVTAGSGKEIKLDVDGGEGNDTVKVNVQGLTVHEDGEFKARLDGDDGNDVFSVVADDVRIDGEASLRVEGEEGDDSLSLTATGIRGELELKIDVETFTTGPVNQPATFGGDTSGSGAEDGGPITGTLTVSDLIDGIAAPNFSVSAAAANGTATIDGTSGAWSYTPAADFNGSDSFTVSATDDKGNIETQVIGITVTEVNDAPTGVDDLLPTVEEDSGLLTIAFADLLGNDSAGPDNESGQTLTITEVASAVGGTAVINGTNVEFTLAADFNGTASFVYTLQDNGTTNGVDDFLTGTATASFTVSQVNDPASFAGDTSGTGVEDGGPITGTLSVTDTADGLTAAIFAVSLAAANGTAAIDGSTGAWSYTPAADFNGSDSFTVSTTDDDGNTETQVIELTVT